MLTAIRVATPSSDH